MYKTHRYPTRDGAAVAKQHGQKHGRRAALGDITNSSAAGNANAKAGKTKMSKPSFSIASSTSSAASSSAAVSSRSHAHARGPVRDVDANDRLNPQMCTTYVNEIYDHLRVVENQPGYTPTSTYISKQKDINEKMRAILYDWIVEVHLKFKLKPETLYLTMNIMDRYLDLKQVSRKKLQLLGVTALLLASKYEEIYPPEVRDLVYVCDRAYNRQQILAMESEIVNAFNFRMTVATIHPFLARFCKVAGLRERGRYVAHYFAERSLQEYAMLKYKPSMVAAAAVYLALQAKYQGNSYDPWPPTVEHYVKYSERDIQQCSEDIRALCAKGQKSSLKAVNKKYGSTKFCVAYELASKVF